ncbi:uncharacterized protein BDZ99DRAFT_263080, partial [Mytilinidion resinicola]
PRTPEVFKPTPTPSSPSSFQHHTLHHHRSCTHSPNNNTADNNPSYARTVAPSILTSLPRNSVLPRADRVLELAPNPPIPCCSITPSTTTTAVPTDPHSKVTTMSSLPPPPPSPTPSVEEPLQRSDRSRNPPPPFPPLDPNHYTSWLRPRRGPKQPKSTWEPRNVTADNAGRQMAQFTATCGLGEVLVEKLTNPYCRGVEYYDIGDYCPPAGPKPKPFEYPQHTPALARGYLAMARILIPAAISRNKALIREAAGFGENPILKSDLRWNNLIEIRKLEEQLEMPVETLTDPERDTMFLVDDCSRIAAVLKGFEEMNGKLTQYKARDWQGLKMRHVNYFKEEDEELADTVSYDPDMWYKGDVNDPDQLAEVQRRRHRAGSAVSCYSYTDNEYGDDDEEGEEEEEDGEEQERQGIAKMSQDPNSMEHLTETAPPVARRNPMFGRTSTVPLPTLARAHSTQNGRNSNKRARISTEEHTSRVEEDEYETDESSAGSELTALEDIEARLLGTNSDDEGGSD